MTHDTSWEHGDKTSIDGYWRVHWDWRNYNGFCRYTIESGEGNYFAHYNRGLGRWVVCPTYMPTVDMEESIPWDESEFHTLLLVLEQCEGRCLDGVLRWDAP